MRIWMVAMLALAGVAQADGIIQCRGADGKVTFSDKPCPGGQTGKAVELSKPVNYGSGAANAPLRNMDRMFSAEREEEERMAELRAGREKARREAEEKSAAAQQASREQQARLARERDAGKRIQTAPPGHTIPIIQDPRTVKRDTPAEPQFIDPVACDNAERMFNASGRSSGVRQTTTSTPAGGWRTHEVIDLKQRALYDDVVRACGKAPKTRY